MVSFSFKIYINSVIIIIIMCVCMHVHVCVQLLLCTVEVRKECARIVSLFSPCRSQGSNSGNQALLSTESSQDREGVWWVSLTRQKPHTPVETSFKQITNSAQLKVKLLTLLFFHSGQIRGKCHFKSWITESMKRQALSIGEKNLFSLIGLTELSITKRKGTRRYEGEWRH